MGIHGEIRSRENQAYVLGGTGPNFLTRLAGSTTGRSK